MKHLLILTFISICLVGCSKGESNNVSSDEPSAYTDISSKIEIPCPAQTATTAVLFAFGQSNSANTGEHIYQNTNLNIVNYFEGHCYVASDPILGATENSGSVWIPLSNRILLQGTYNQVVIIAAGVGGSAVEKWTNGGDLYERYIGRLQSAASQYEVTHYLWHQGEADAFTAAQSYTSSLSQVIAAALTSSPNARFYVSVATLCGSDITHPLIEQAQRDITNGINILPGPDTDDGIPSSMRQSDHCHMSSAAQEVFADLWLSALQPTRVQY